MAADASTAQALQRAPMRGTESAVDLHGRRVGKGRRGGTKLGGTGPRVTPHPGTARAPSAVPCAVVSPLARVTALSLSPFDPSAPTAAVTSGIGPAG